MNQIVLYRKETVDMNKSIFVMYQFILPTIRGSSLDPPTTLPTSWFEVIMDLRMAGNKNAAALLIGLVGRNRYCNELKSVRMSLLIWTILCWLRILKYQVNDNHIWSLIAGTISFSKTNISTINPHILIPQLVLAMVPNRHIKYWS
jgi:hypothetical protein